MRKYICTAILTVFVSFTSLTAQYEDNMIKLSQDFLKALQDKKPTEEYKKVLADIDLDKLASQIDTDRKRLAFWINIYNAYIMDILKDAPGKYDDRGEFFKADQIKIAGKNVSFDDIEHGVIRSSVLKLSWGYFSKWFVSEWERKLRTDHRDYRIHFALNCGAKSCPPVAIYDDQTINEDLEEITEQYLTRVSEYKEEEDKVITTPLMSWFRGDFGGKSGSKEILEKFDIIPNTDVELEFGDYDWTLDLFNFTTI
ncbi:DUF547 domain-containing protein [Portibacter marinus]|uniref:DUF547 domain-containing protein n=1 Tax=Portibacter marinus TaxID=2898660 RepID=UPI001F3B4219|nr:DUF547 domain-containing protein [Portibacter marinus]